MVKLDDYERYPLLFGPSPVHPLKRLSEFLGGDVSIWAKREDCNSGIAFGGNKVRKLEYIIPDAINKGCDTLVSIGGIQSNHTRQVTGVAAHQMFAVTPESQETPVVLTLTYGPERAAAVESWVSRPADNL